MSVDKWVAEKLEDYCSKLGPALKADKLIAVAELLGAINILKDLKAFMEAKNAG